MQNPCRNTPVFVQGLPKSLRAFPQLSRPMLATRIFPSRHGWCPQPGSEERAGEVPAWQTRPRLSCAHLPSLAGLQECAPGSGLHPEFWGRSPVHLQNRTCTVLPAPLLPVTWSSAERNPHSLPTLLAPCSSPIWAELTLDPKPSRVSWGRASNPHSVGGVGMLDSPLEPPESRSRSRSSPCAGSCGHSS